MNHFTFAELPPELKGRAVYQEIAANQIFVQQGEAATSMNFLLEGLLELVTFTDKQIINLYFVSAGESFGEIALFSDTYAYYAIADLPSRVASIDKETFKQAVEENIDMKYPIGDQRLNETITFNLSSKQTKVCLHEITAPLTVIFISLPYLEKEILSEQSFRYFIPALNAAERLKQILQETKRQTACGNYSSVHITDFLTKLQISLDIIFLGLSSLEKETLSEQNFCRFTLAIEEAARLKRMLLNNSWLETKSFPIENKQRLDIKELLIQTIQIMRFLPCPAKCQIKLNAPSEKVWILGNCDQLKQVFINLIKNACEATPQGRDIFCNLNIDAENNLIYIEIINLGQPIPSKILPHIARHFVTTKSNGMGLGLVIVKQIVEKHKGKFSITSSKTLGTKVVLQLPKA